MKYLRLTMIMGLAAAIAPPAAASAADTAQADATVVTTLRADGSANPWTEADLRSALGLLNRKYWRDMSTDAGRREWHGAIVPERCGVVTNDEGKVFRRDVYADGYSHDTPFRPRPTAGRRRGRPQVDRLAALRAKEADLAARVKAGDVTDERYARDLLELRRIQRMIEREEARRTTNTVTVVVTPEAKETAE